MKWFALLFLTIPALEAAGPLRLIIDDLLDAGADLVDSVSDLWEGHRDETEDDGKVIGLAAVAGCARFNGKCKDCAKTQTCAYCADSKICAEDANDNSAIGTCEWITKKRKCPGGLSWWQILLIVLACICLAPLIALCCFVYVIKKLCCPNDMEMDD